MSYSSSNALRAVFGILAMLVFTTGVSAQSTYAVRAGDVLTIEVLEDAALNRSALVLPDGSISFPLVGVIPVAGKSVAAIKSALTSGLASNFATAPNVFVSVSRLGERAARKAAGHAKIAVYALGALNNPGKAEISAGTTLLQFLAQAGGFTKFAATKRIQLRRTDSATGQAEMFTFNFFALERGGRISGMIQLREGDVIVVPERRLFE